MEVSASRTAMSPPPAEAAPAGRLAALRALQKALETETPATPIENPSDDGKGRHLDLRC